MKINVVKHVLAANDLVATENREVFRKAGILAVNIISSPGSGKTTLLEHTIPALGKVDPSIVVVGDLQTTRDAERVSDKAIQVTQINTGMSCHLYANQIAESLPGLNLEKAGYLFIENVGNLVCPGEFDLGENVKVILLSIPEGDDKVAKYPTVFRVADIILLTKIDLLNSSRYNLQRVYDDINKLNPTAKVIEFSSLTGQGMEAWLEWLQTQKQQSVGAQAKFVKE
ncbi:MAG: hydrogenase nickel incorporation protein HypB [Deltaproteobacteria bacterium]|nr:hydrogenase nickel incorporation protein HypB [Deltaproteobacteria bacterium]